MSLFRRKPDPVLSEDSSWVTPGTGKHARSAPIPADVTGPAPATRPARGSHRASTPATPVGPAADQA